MLLVLPIQYKLGATPDVVFQSIASGALGKRAFHDGLYAVVLGIGFHVFISLCAAAAFLFIAMRWSVVRRHWALSGMLYGVFVYVVMTFVVIPLSAIGFAMPRSLGRFLMSFSIHIFAFGLPIALVCRFFVRRYQPSRSR
jgi:uncharacterized membrane protein YagU involved in acid resistance